MAPVLVATVALLPLNARAADSPAIGCLAASVASIKFDNEHRLRAERTELLACAAASCPTDIRNECIRRVDEVNAAIPTIIFEVKDEAGNDLVAVKVTMDSEVLVDHLDGMAIAVDPGPHKFVFEVVGRPKVQKQFVIRQGQKNRSELVIFEAVMTARSSQPARSASVPRSVAVRVGPKDATSEATAGSTPSADSAPATGNGSRPAPSSVDMLSSSAAPRSRSERTPVDSPSSGGRKALTLVAAGIGVVGIGVGAVFGWQALSKRDDAQEVCPTLCRDSDGTRMWQDAKRAGNVSTVAFAIGGLGLAGAALLWLTGGSEAAVAPSVEYGQAGVTTSLRGRW